MKDLNETFVHLNVGLPDDVERLKAAGYYKEAMARIDEYLAEDWTETQNSPRSQGLEMPEYEQPANPVPHGVDALRDALLVQKEIMRRLPQEYCWNEAQAVARMQGLVRDFTVEEFRQLVHEGRVDWRFVEGEKHYLDRFAETLIATHADLAARQLDPPAPATLARERRHRIHDQMEREGQASARITLKTSVGMSDEAFAAALAWGLKGWDLRRVTAKCFRENHPSRHMLAACMDPTGEDETYFYFEKCIQNENDMHMDILSE